MVVDTSLSDSDLIIMKRIMNSEFSGIKGRLETRLHQINKETVRLIGLGYVVNSRHPLSDDSSLLRVTGVGNGKYSEALAA